MKCFCLCVAILLGRIGYAADQGKVFLPMQTWEQMQRELADGAKPERPSAAVLPVDRQIDGALRKGLFSGTLTARVRVLDTGGHVRVPVVDSAASLGEVKLNGAPTSLLSESGMYTAGVEEPGVYTVQARLFWGREQDRFARRLKFRIPEAGPTAVSILVPEKDIEARLSNGVIAKQQERPDGTLLLGHLDPSGLFDLTWNRKLTHRAGEKARLEARLYTLFNVHEALVSGQAVFDLNVLEGEIDRVDLKLPADIEVLRVEGDAVLQWYTEAREDGQLVVLFRYLVGERTRLTVHFQFPAGQANEVRLRTPLPPPGVAMTAFAGIQGLAGLNIRVVENRNAQALQPHELPPELTELTPNPILFGMRFIEQPDITVSVSRHEAVELTTTLIDELQSSTVLAEDGWEVTKIKLRMRNNVRQYLSVELPHGAVLTHSLIDGEPVRPASPAGNPTALLFPLRQSERIGPAGETRHAVCEGETLSDIANFYYSDPAGWRGILQANANVMADEWDLQTGQELRIPAVGNVQESSFVIELAYKRKHAPLGAFGRALVALPNLDVDAVQAIWHLYLPESLAPLAFSSNLTQYSAIRYDHFRRVRDFLERVLWERRAWAGSKRYRNIFIIRRDIYKTESRRKAEGEMVLASFPLVGERYKFKSILLGTAAPRIAFTYTKDEIALAIRWIAFLAAFGMTLLLLRQGRERRSLIAALIVLAIMLAVAYYVMGVHRRILWGVDLALLIALLRLRGPDVLRRAREIAQSPWILRDLITISNLMYVWGILLLVLFLMRFPLLLSTTALALLGVGLWRSSRREVRP